MKGIQHLWNIELPKNKNGHLTHASYKGGKDGSENKKEKETRQNIKEMRQYSLAKYIQF